MCQKDWDKSIDAKAAHKMLLKLIPRVDSTKILRAAFSRADPKKHKKD